MRILLAVDLDGGVLLAVFVGRDPGGGHHHLVEVYYSESICIAALYCFPRYGNLKMNPRQLLITQDLGDLNLLLADHVLAIYLCQLCISKLLPSVYPHEISCPFLQRISDL